MAPQSSNSKDALEGGDGRKNVDWVLMIDMNMHGLALGFTGGMALERLYFG